MEENLFSAGPDRRSADKETRESTRFWQGFAVGLLVVIAGLLLAGHYLKPVILPGSVRTEKGLGDREMAAMLEKTNFILNTVQNEYVLEDIPKEVLVEGIYQGIMGTLTDRYATYYTAEEYENIKRNAQGSYGGMGFTLSNERVIVEVKPKTPAEQAGLKADDVIVAVNGTDITEMTQTEYMTHLRGKVGDVKDLTIVRPSTGETLEISVTLAIIENETVTWKWLPGGIAYLKLSAFENVSEHQFDDAWAEITQNENFKGFILDLRSNPGGGLGNVTHIARSLVPEGLIAYTEDKRGNVEEFKSTGTGCPVPMAVIVNRNSASASELLTGALKDRGVAVVVGETTYGKGIVQTTWSWGDGSAFKMTTAKYYTPSGEEIQGNGIAPDIEAAAEAGDVEGELETDAVLRAAYEAVSGTEKEAAA